MAKKIVKAKATKSVAAKDLEPKGVKDVKGGLIVMRKAGKPQQEY